MTSGPALRELNFNDHCLDSLFSSALKSSKPGAAVASLLLEKASGGDENAPAAMPVTPIPIVVNAECVASNAAPEGSPAGGDAPSGTTPRKPRKGPSGPLAVGAALEKTVNGPRTPRRVPSGTLSPDVSRASESARTPRTPRTPSRNVSGNLGDGAAEAHEQVRKPRKSPSGPISADGLPAEGEVVVEIEYPESSSLKPLESPALAAKDILDKLKSPVWLTACAAMTAVRQMALYHAPIAGEHLPSIMPQLLKSLKSARSALNKSALLTLTDLITSLRDAVLPQLHTVLLEVLLKAVQDKKFVSEAAETVLEQLCGCLSPPPLCALMLPYASHRNPRVRAKAATCLADSTARMGLEGILSFGLGSLLSAAGSLLSDSLPEARDSSRRLVALLHSAHHLAVHRECAERVHSPVKAVRDAALVELAALPVCCAGYAPASGGNAAAAGSEDAPSAASVTTASSAATAQDSEAQGITAPSATPTTSTDADAGTGCDAAPASCPPPPDSVNPGGNVGGVTSAPPSPATETKARIVVPKRVSGEAVRLDSPAGSAPPVRTAGSVPSRLRGLGTARPATTAVGSRAAAHNVTSVVRAGPGNMVAGGARPMSAGAAFGKLGDEGGPPPTSWELLCAKTIKSLPSAKAAGKISPHLPQDSILISSS
eukprot:jgi/Mesvir1/28639/Mv15064-RA.1